jgi:DNA-binding transcriptional regulator GbsR (MarR family)
MVQAEHFIELMGRHLEEEGMPRIAGRLMGALLLNPKPATLDGLAQQLGVSKASISSNARLLENHGIATRVTLPGDRRDFYQISSNAEERSLRRQLERHQLLLERLRVGRAAVDDGNEEVLKRFDSLSEFVGKALAHVDAALARRDGHTDQER